MLLQPRSLSQRLSLFLILPVALLLTAAGAAGFLYARNLLLSQRREASLLKLERAAHLVDMKLEHTKDWIGRLEVKLDFEFLIRNLLEAGWCN